MRLFVDDERECPAGWLLARNYAQAIEALRRFHIVAVSLDHDLGEERTGYDVACWIEEHARHVAIGSHSANPVGRARIEQVARALR